MKAKYSERPSAPESFRRGVRLLRRIAKDGRVGNSRALDLDNGMIDSLDEDEIYEYLHMWGYQWTGKYWENEAMALYIFDDDEEMVDGSH